MFGHSGNTGLTPDEQETLEEFVRELHKQRKDINMAELVKSLLGGQPAVERKGNGWSREHNAQLRIEMSRNHNPYNPYHQALNAIAQAALDGDLDIEEGDRDYFITFIGRMKNITDFDPEGDAELNWKNQPAVGRDYPTKFNSTEEEKQNIVNDFRDVYEGYVRGKETKEIAEKSVPSLQRGMQQALTDVSRSLEGSGVPPEEARPKAMHVTVHLATGIATSKNRYDPEATRHAAFLLGFVSSLGHHDRYPTMREFHKHIR